jgi:putative ABC transport system substrate-binding protein
VKDRRAFLATLTAGLLAAPLAAKAQQVGKMPRVGYLNPGSSSDPVRQRRLEALRQGLRELGYVEGQNLALELRWAEGKYDRYPALAADLVRSKVTSSWRGVVKRPRPHGSGSSPRTWRPLGCTPKETQHGERD